MPVQIEHPTRFKYISKIILQISLLLAFWWIGSILQSLFKLPVSGAVIGLFIVLTGLLTGFLNLNGSRVAPILFWVNWFYSLFPVLLD